MFGHFTTLCMKGLMMLCRALFRWRHAVLLTLQHENSDFPGKTTKFWKSRFLLCCYKHRTNSCKSRLHIPDINLTYRSDFLFETVEQLVEVLVIHYALVIQRKDKKYPE